jgi:hypothetical protein
MPARMCQACFGDTKENPSMGNGSWIGYIGFVFVGLLVFNDY